MSLRYLVPSLGLLACTAGFATAADVGGNLSINGYVDSTFGIENLGDDLVTAGRPGVHKTKAADGSNTVVGFTTNAQTEFGYKVGAVKADIELFYSDAGIAVEQAYIDWMVEKDLVNVKMGRMDTVLGLEALDRPQLYRVNFSNMLTSGLLGGNGDVSSMFIEGAMVGFKAGQISGGVAVVNGIYDFTGIPGWPAVKNNTDLGLLGTVKFVQEKVVTVKGTIAFDMGAGVNDSGEATGAFGLDLTAESKEWVKDLAFGGEFALLSAGELSGFGILGFANYKLPVGVPMSVTGMVDYLSETVSDNKGSELEIAAALLINPTKEDNFATNLEVRYIARDVEDIGGGTDADEFGVFFEMVAVIP